MSASDEWMDIVKVSPSVTKHAESSKSRFQTTSGRISELISKGVKYEQEVEN